MDVSLFEIVGPIMIGPSSSATAGMARIGATVHKFLDDEVESINLRFTPLYGKKYAGSRSHAAIIAGVMGFSEYDPAIRNAVQIARDRGIDLSASIFPDPAPAHTLTVEVTVGLKSGVKRSYRAISIGGGSIEVLKIEGFDVELSGTEAYVFVWADQGAEAGLRAAFDGCPFYVSDCEGEKLYYINVPEKEGEGAAEKARRVAGVQRAVFMAPVIPQGYVPHTPLFTTFEELLALGEKTGKRIHELALDYEANRSGHTQKEVWDQMEKQLKVMQQATHAGLYDKMEPLYGFNKGDDGKRVLAAYEAGKSISGTVFPRALAIALANMEYSGAMAGSIVAAPTAACGTFPGCLLALQEEKGYSDDEIVRAMLIGAVIGVVIRFHGSTFSGSAGGCQAEVGVTSAMAAAGMVYLNGGDDLHAVHAAALAIKNILGLICDPISCAEIPCIKRMGSGVANAFTAAELANCGILSFIPPDEVMESFVGVQKAMPIELRQGGCGCTGTPTALAAKKFIDEKDREILLRQV